MEFDSYNPYNSNNNACTPVVLEPDEELIGVYGFYGDKTYDSFFHSFGFIVKVGPRS